MKTSRTVTLSPWPHSLPPSIMALPPCSYPISLHLFSLSLNVIHTLDSSLPMFLLSSPPHHKVSSQSSVFSFPFHSRGEHTSMLLLPRGNNFLLLASGTPHSMGTVPESPLPHFPFILPGLLLISSCLSFNPVHLC